ncbi:fluoride efflux transporter FluC [bacterium]
MELLYVGFGGALGSILRYFVTSFIANGSNYGTFLVNAAGSITIGLLWALFQNNLHDKLISHFIFIGILGGFTTFSWYMLDAMKLLHTGRSYSAFFYLIISNLVSLSLALAGFFTLRNFFK